MKYDITVTTLMSVGGRKHFEDVITFYDVCDEVKDFVAGSCKLVLGKLIRLPEDKSDQAYILQYRTRVLKAGTKEVISDTKLITFPAMDRAGAVMFKTLAIEELKLTADLINKNLDKSPLATDKRNKFMTLLEMILTRKS